MTAVKTTPPVGRFTLNLGGRERTGRLDMEGLCAVESELGNMSLMAAMADRQRWGFNVTCTVLWQALARENPKITKKHVQTWVQTAIDEGAPLASFIEAAQTAVLCSLGSQVREGVDKFDQELPSVDDGAEEGSKRPLGKGSVKSLQSA